MDFIKMADEIVKAMSTIKYMASEFEKADCKVDFDNATCTFKITPPVYLIPPGVLEDIEWLKASKIDYSDYEDIFRRAGTDVTEYSTWGNPFQSPTVIGIWKAADVGDANFTLIFKADKTYPIYVRYNPDIFGGKENEAFMRDEFGVLHRVVRA